MTINVKGNWQDYNNAITYLKKGSNKACAIIMRLQMLRDPIEVLTKENYDAGGFSGSHYWPPRGNEPARIHWWVYDWTDLGMTKEKKVEIKKDQEYLNRANRIYMNPAMALIHELGHAYQHHILGKAMTRWNWRSVEKHNVQTFEKPIAIELGQPHRNQYVEGYPMGNRRELFKEMGKGPMIAI